MFYCSVSCFPAGSDFKESTCNAGDPGSIPESGRSPGEGNGNPLQYSHLENPTERGAWWATVHGVSESQTRLSVSTVCWPELQGSLGNVVQLRMQEEEDLGVVSCRFNHWHRTQGACSFTDSKNSKHLLCAKPCYGIYTWIRHSPGLQESTASSSQPGFIRQL